MSINIGEYLKEKRLERGYSFEYVTEKTKINLYILEKIEKNLYEDSLSEVHFMGFIRNLCELYEVDPSEAIKIYRKDQGLDQIKEENIDVKEIKQPEVKDKKRKEIIYYFFKEKQYLLFGVLILVLLLILFFYFFKYHKEVKSSAPKNEKRMIYKMNSNENSYDLKKMDMIQIFFDTNYKLFTLKDIIDNKILFSIENYEGTLKEGGSVEIDLNGDDKKDLALDFKKKSGDLVYIYFHFLEKNQGVDYDAIWKNQDKVLVGYEYTLIKYSEKTPINVYIKAGKLSSYISYVIDGSQQSNFTLKPNQENITVAENTLEITIGNYRDVKMIVNKIPLNLTIDHGKFSETKVLKWIKDVDNETKYNLVIKDYVEETN